MAKSGYSKKTTHGPITQVGNPRTPKPPISGPNGKTVAKRAQDGTMANKSGK